MSRSQPGGACEHAVGSMTTDTSRPGPTTTVPTSMTEGELPIDPALCPEIGPDRLYSAVGPLFVCDRQGERGGYGGQVVPRSDVANAEEAVVAWLAGPTEAEQEAGLQGWDLQPYPWLADSLTLSRDGSTIIMDVGEWMPINNLSTSNGSAVFLISLQGTVFSDPSVEQFEFSIMGENCPVFIGEPELCFLVSWDDFTGSIG